LSNIAEDGEDFDNVEVKNGAFQIYAKYNLFGKK
jgi:hypothetical protein